MTNEEMQRTMQFIIEQQAQFAVNIQKVEEAQLRDTPRLQRVEAAFVELVELARTADERLDRLTDSYQRLIELQAKTEARLVELADAQARTDARLVTLSEATERHLGQVGGYVERLALAQARTDERLSQLTETVSQYIRASRNGSE